MPAFHFKFRHNPSDDVVAFYDNVGAAKDEAAKTAGAMIGDAGANAWNCDDWSVTVSDPAGFVLFALLIKPVDVVHLTRVG